jgi:vacuolar-type H+-ATPase subunit I/STV1
MQGFDIVPTANAEMSTKMQRITTAQIELEQFPLVLQAGGNPVPLVKNFYEAIGSNLTDQLFPEESALPPEDKKRIEQMREAQELQNKINMLQLEILKREQDRLDDKTASELEVAQKEIEKMNSEIAKNFASALKTGEEAETEALQNQIASYTSRVLELITTQRKAIDDRPIEVGTALRQIVGTDNQRTIQ